jgi:hypothetical protein
VGGFNCRTEAKAWRVANAKWNGGFGSNPAGVFYPDGHLEWCIGVEPHDVPSVPPEYRPLPYEPPARPKAEPKAELKAEPEMSDDDFFDACLLWAKE